MTPRESHTQYVERLVELADRGGKEMTGAFMARFAIVMKKSGKSLAAFLDMMRVAKKILVPMATKIGKTSLDRGRVLGREYGKTKIKEARSA